MKETPETIHRWVEDTFPGSDPTTPRKAIRMLEEAFELCLADGASKHDIEQAMKKVFEKHGDQRYWERRPDPAAVPKEAADVYIVLAGHSGLKGYDLHRHVDEKMQINRQRDWIPMGDGTGYHIPEPSVSE